MSSVIFLAPEIPQPTDTNMLSGSTGEHEKDNSTLFSNLMEQHKEEAQSGKTKNIDGNIEHQCEHEKLDDVAAKKNDNEKSESNSEVEEVVESVESKVVESDTTEPSIEAPKIEASSEQQVQSKASDVTEDLLLFLNAAENTLVKPDNKENKTDVVVDKTISEANNKVKELADDLIGKPSSTSEKNADITVETSENMESDTPKFDKTLIAQSVSEQKHIDENTLNKEIKKLLASKTEENTAVMQESKIEDSVDNELKQKISKENTEVISPVQNKNAIPATTSEEKIVETKNIVVNELSKTDVDKVVSSDDTIQFEDGNLDEHMEVNEIKPSSSSDKVSEINPSSSFDKVSEINSSLNKAEDAKNKKVIQADEALEQSILPTSKQSSVSNTESIITSNIVTADKSTTNKNKTQEKLAVDQKGQTTSELEVDMVVDELSNNAELKPLSVNNIVKPEVTSLFDSLSQNEANKARLQESRFIQNELSFESVMQNLSADTVQMQKNTLIQQTEIISIMRKDFTDAVKDKVMVMINQKIQQVDIQLDPPEFGNMQVRVNLQNDQAVVSFVVQNQQAKDALEQNMDKLKQAMSENGVDIGETNVKQESGQSSMNEQKNGGSGSLSEEGENELMGQSISSEHAKMVKASSTGVDFYA